MNKKLWIIGYFFIVLIALLLVTIKVIQVDPYFHYHYPKTDSYSYKMDWDLQRYVNYGIVEHFDYSGIIAGTSMIENFKTSEAEAIFGEKFVKIPYSGGSYNEINKTLEKAVSHNPELRVIIRGLDLSTFCRDKNLWPNEMGGIFPFYLYDDNYLNDVKYIYNRDVLFSRVYPMIIESGKPGSRGGITSFDEYSNWMRLYRFGPKSVYPNGLPLNDKTQPSVMLTQDDIKTIRENIQQNVTAMALKNPEITFYCFFPPNSAAWWKSLIDEGKLEWQIQAEKIVIEEILKYDNIKLFSFSCFFDITTDLNNYKDKIHYGEWINSLILYYMYNGIGQITSENYEQYLNKEYDFYMFYDYTKLTEQDDYADDYYAAEIIKSKMISAVN